MTLQPVALMLCPQAHWARWLHQTADFLTNMAPMAAHDLLLPQHTFHREQRVLQMDTAACVYVNDPVKKNLFMRI